MIFKGCVSSMALRSKNVCFTNVPKDDREALQKKVARMAGYICSTMTQEVDILVVGEASSKKYIVASELGWVKNQKLAENGSSKRIKKREAKFRVRIFEILTINAKLRFALLVSIRLATVSEN